MFPSNLPLKSLSLPTSQRGKFEYCDKAKQGGTDKLVCPCCLNTSVDREYTTLTNRVCQCHPGIGLQRIKISLEMPPDETFLHGILKMWVRISLKKGGKKEGFSLEKSLPDQTYQTFPLFLKGD
ncbi:MAG: hypothetical protein NG784_14995, partial [Candidatus Jettenia sp.]|nr:hypothetical protein [Candidatus Jettenia sp.]